MGNVTSRLSLAIVVVVGLTGFEAPAVTATGTLLGYVYDQTGDPLMNVPIVVRPKPRGRARRASTDWEGAFRSRDCSRGGTACGRRCPG